jgi:hypothetical protein
MAVRPGSHIRNPQRDPRTAKVSTQVSSWLNFTPLSLNPQLWLDAADTATITESSGAVSQWDDKSGNGRHFTQATGANQPATGTNTRNGLNVITFDGGSDFLRLGSSDLGRNVTGATVYMVYRHAVSPQPFSGRVFTISTGAGTAPARIFIIDGATSQRSQTGGRTLDGDTFAFVTGTAVIATDYMYRASVFDYANTDLFNYLNGVVDGSTTSFQTATTTSDTASQRSGIGADLNNVATVFFNGQMAEMLVYHTAHTTAQRVTVETYLKTKWGL